MPPRPVSGTDSLDEAVDNFHHVATVLRGVQHHHYQHHYLHDDGDDDSIIVT